MRVDQEFSFECVAPWIALIRDGLEKYSHGEATIENYQDMLADGNAQLWTLRDDSGRVAMLAVTRILKYPSLSRLSFDYVWGNGVDEALPFMWAIEQWAAAQGVTHTEAWVRPGLRKKLVAVGFQHAYDVVVRPIHRGLN